MERVFYKTHDKVSKTALQYTTLSQRSFIETTILFLAIISFSTVIVCHRTFVYRGGAIKSQAVNKGGWNIPNSCLMSVNGLNGVNGWNGLNGNMNVDVDVTHVVIYNSITSIFPNNNSNNNNNNDDEDKEKEKMMYCTQQQEEQEQQNSNTNESIKKQSNHDNGCCSTESTNNNNSKNNKNDDATNKSFVIYIEPLTGIHHSSKPLIPSHNPHNPHHSQTMQNIISKVNIIYSFSSTRGYLFLPPTNLSYHNISSQYIFIHIHDSKCFSDDPFLQRIGLVGLEEEEEEQEQQEELEVVGLSSSKSLSSRLWTSFLIGVRDTIVLNWILGFIRRDGDRSDNTSGGMTMNHPNKRKWYIHYKRNGLIIDLEDYLNEYLFRWPTGSGTDIGTSAGAGGIDDKSNNVESSSTSSSSDDSSSIDTNNNAFNSSNQQQTIRWHHHFIIFKIGVLISSLFLFFATTTLVSFTLRETQDRMLHFTFQLQTHIRRRLPIAYLIFTHVIENMVFAPIMLGIIFFLTDCCYNGDRFLAFVILSGVWICEVFSAISMRTIHSSVYYPQVFFAYFTLFHIYYFSCPFGFSYAALMSTTLFQLHSMIFFWNRYELPAILSGQISYDRPRMVLGHGMNVQSHNENNRNATVLSSPQAVTEGNVYHHHPNSSSSVLSTGQEMQRLRSSYPSMSSLGGRISSYDGYWMSLDGEVSSSQYDQVYIFSIFDMYYWR
jgi:hypothetical protein